MYASSTDRSEEEAYGYHEEYRSKCVSPGAAAGLINPGDVVEYGQFNGKPVAFDSALAARKDELHDVAVFCGVCVPPYPETAKHPDSFVFTDLHWTGLTRMIDANSTVYYGPVTFRKVPDYMRYYEGTAGWRSCYYNDKARADKTKKVYVARVAPMDEHGNFNFGAQNSYHSAGFEACDLAIVEVNKNFPVCMGGAQESIHISRVDRIVEDERIRRSSRPGRGSQRCREKDRRKRHELHPRRELPAARDRRLPNAIGRMIAASDLRDLAATPRCWSTPM